MRKSLIQALLFITTLSICAVGQEDKPELLIHCDDIGMSHSLNLALAEMIQTNIPFSTSVMFTYDTLIDRIVLSKMINPVSTGYK